VISSAARWCAPLGYVYAFIARPHYAATAQRDAGVLAQHDAASIRRKEGIQWSAEDDREGETNARREGERLDVAASATPDGYATRVAYYALRKLNNLPNSQLD
jgi:hypothetical protein